MSLQRITSPTAARAAAAVAIGVALLAPIGASSQAAAQTPLQGKLVASDGAGGDRFRDAAAISGDIGLASRNPFRFLINVRGQPEP